MSKLTEIHQILLHHMAYAAGKGYVQKPDVEKAEQAILDWIDKEIIGEDEQTSVRELSRRQSIDDALDEKQGNLARNELRAEMRKKLGR